MLKTFSDSILSIVFPQECRICGREVEFSEDGVACSGCWEATRIFTGDETLCNKCGAFLFGVPSGSAASCGKCDEHSYDRAFSVGLYEKALSASVLELKTTPRLGGRIKRLLVEAFDRVSIQGSPLMIPVPLSSRRLAERGFNQAAVIGNAVSQCVSFAAIDESSLVRKQHTPMHRAGMDKKARALTVKNAFEVLRPRLIEGRDILLIDDIFTSGETASNCAKILKKNGAATVSVLTIARTA